MDRKEYQKEWRKKNKGYSSEYYHKYKQKINARRKITRVKYKDKTNKASKKWREQNKGYQQEYYNKNKEKIKKQVAENPKRRTYRQKAQMKDYKENPLKFKARALALRYIKIPTGHLCEICFNDLAVNRHHKDYNKPFEVVLLCKKCHIAIHNAERC